MASNFYPSANMGLPIPSVGIDSGPDYASNVNAALTLVDSHDHSAGKGVQITPAGLNINSDLTMASNNLINARSLRIAIQNAPLALATDINCLYDVSGDLFFNDGSGNQIQITQSGGIAGSPGSIANLTSPASASYVSANSTFVWQSAANTPANMDGASVLLRNLSANSKALTLSPPAAMAANYSVTLPSLPLTASVVSIDASGNMGTGVAGTVKTNDIADSNVTTIKIAAANVTRAKLEALGQQVSASSGGFTTTSASTVDVTNLSLTITTTGRPVEIKFQSDPSTAGSSESLIGVSRSASLASANFSIWRDSTSVSLQSLRISCGGATSVQSYIPSGSLNFTDYVAAGTYTYKLRCNNAASLATVNVINIVMSVFEQV